MLELKDSDVFLRNTTVTTKLQTSEDNDDLDFMTLLSIIISSVGIIASLTVAIVFVRHKVLRQKVPIIFVINQVRSLFLYVWFDTQLSYIMQLTLFFVVISTVWFDQQWIGI